jgi:hypothetical protein
MLCLIKQYNIKLLKVQQRIVQNIYFYRLADLLPAISRGCIGDEQE